jgi:hypothetical protein
MAAPVISLLAAYPKARRWVGLAMIVLALAVVASLAAREMAQPQDGKPQPAAPAIPPLQAADPAITAVMIEPPVATIWADVKGAETLKANLDRAQAITGAIGQALKRGVSDDLSGVDTLRIRLRADAVDRFGHDLMAPLLTLDIDPKVLKAAKGPRVMGLAKTVSLTSPGTYDAAAAWCMDAAKSDPAFCAKVPK